MIELAEQQKGDIVEPSNGGLKDVRISSESSPFRHVEVLSQEDLQLTEQAAYERGKKEAEANLQQQLDLMKAEYATEKDKELADFCDNIRSDLGGQVPKILESLEKHVINLAADIAMKIAKLLADEGYQGPLYPKAAAALMQAFEESQSHLDDLYIGVDDD